jgi:hypothetical protein
VKGRASAIVAGLVFGGAVATAAAQAPTQTPAAQAPTAVQALQDPQPARFEPAQTDAKESRYQVGVMERVIESAVEHGATIMRDRLQAALPAQLLLPESARVRGFRLDGYGLFFDVEVPPVSGTLDASLLWSLRTLDQNDLGLDSALKALKTYVDSANDPNLQQAFKRIELQVTPGPGVSMANVSTGARKAAGSAASVPSVSEKRPTIDPILNDPQEAYHKEVNDAVIDAMLEHSGPLAIAPDEWLTIAERGIQDTARLAPADTDSHTVLIRVNGATLKAFRMGQITKEEALTRIEVRVF